MFVMSDGSSSIADAVSIKEGAKWQGRSGTALGGCQCTPQGAWRRTGSEAGRRMRGCASRAPGAA